MPTRYGRIALMLLTGVATSWFLVGCGTGAQGSAIATPPREDAPDLVLQGVDGTALEPGGVAELVYQVEDIRGMPHVLQRWDGQEWVDLLYGVVSDKQSFAENPGTPWKEGSWRGLAWDDIGYEGLHGGLFITVPEEVNGQIVRLCSDGLLCSGAYDFR